MKVFLDTIGCRLNQSEIEIMAGQFRQTGHEIVATPAEADMVIINTCAVTSAASSDSRNKVRQAARSSDAQIILTGCWATLEPEAAAELPGVENVFLNPDKDNLVAEILKINPEVFDIEPLAREPLPGAHQRTRAFLKVQDGCDNFCTFCITRVARGAGVSKSMEDVINDVNWALAGGVKEVVLSGVHLGSWGRDFERPRHLKDLLQAILSYTDVPRLRLSSLEPWDLGEDFFSVWEDKRMCRHLHLPLQSGAKETLKRMARKTTPTDFRKIVSDARSVAPDMAITTDMIVGFPGESDEDFAETLDYVKQIDFAGGHIFTYSARQGTPAAKYKDQVRGPIRKRRSAVLRAAFAEMAYRYHQRFLGETLDVLWESSQQSSDGTWQLKGLTGNYLKVAADCSHNHWNEIDNVRLLSFEGDLVKGEIIG
ncbi:MAG: tRNA (N(6)-L-threonylcarbamoyladenosine(37)-C(2))-methylthiotransferase MtaB [Anaerolineaceae bacterium]|nr:tRNA (N(6)-L-threonylcarbamoyladenosine(37)-C(2))-methylthiotransferase MtaB [Anaerolineaceae bacterium]